MLSLFFFIFTIYCVNLVISGFEMVNLIIFLESLNILFILCSGLILISTNPLLWVYFIVTATLGVVFILCLLSRLWFCDNFFL
uniref:NADH dehydrogenase subunit 4L n=1 Tax=Gyrodactylus kobayashii TaxID=89149 RepID=A0A166A453_9PLAT|nr:NADH dehydrogenase subunit 4L [Gyrodactylus kobayashii]AMZ79728.1 NADH dehydrogenase subunit 4L [Gyrodactylus kobayashii]